MAAVRLFGVDNGSGRKRRAGQEVPPPGEDVTKHEEVPGCSPHPLDVMAIYALYQMFHDSQLTRTGQVGRR